jgi:hypothetical protein
MPIAAFLPARRLAAALLLALVVALGAFAGSARADFGFENVGCGTRHFTKSLELSTTERLELFVIHNPGRWGQMTVRNSAGSEVWSFRQSYAWITGMYRVRSNELPPGTYTVEYWSDNLAQLQNFCHGSLSFSHDED